MKHLHRTKSFLLINIFLCAALLLQNVTLLAHACNEDDNQSAWHDSYTHPTTTKTWDESARNQPYHNIQSNNQGYDQVPAPLADTTPLDPELLDNVLRNCPEKITTIINALQNARDNTRQSFPKKLLLIGPSGTGKTTLGKTIAAQAGLPFFGYSGAAISNAYKNSGTMNLERIFLAAAQLGEPCVVMIDEFSEMFKQYKNEKDTDSGTLTRLWQLLDQYAEYPILFIGTLNSANDAPPQIKNRFKRYVVEVPLPDAQQRKQLIMYHLDKYNADIVLDQNVFKKIISKTKGFANRDLCDLVATIIEHATIRDPHSDIIMITADDLSYALSDFKNNDKLLAGTFWERYEKPIKEWAPVCGTAIGAVTVLFTIWGAYQTWLSFTHQIKEAEKNDARHEASMKQQADHQQANQNLQKRHQKENVRLQKEHQRKNELLQIKHQKENAELQKKHHGDTIKQQNIQQEQNRKLQKKHYKGGQKHQTQLHKETIDRQQKNHDETIFYQKIGIAMNTAQIGRQGYDMQGTSKGPEPS